MSSYDPLSKSASAPPPSYQQHQQQQPVVPMNVQAQGVGMVVPFAATNPQSAGVVIRQRQQRYEFAQAAGLPLELANVYSIMDIPPGCVVAASPKDPQRWRPTDEELRSLPVTGQAEEHSSGCVRCVLACCGGLNLRPFTMNVNRSEGAMTIRRPCKCGGFWGSCCRLRTTVYDTSSGVLIGQVKENCDPYCGKCCEACWCCTFYHDILVPAGVDDAGGTGDAGAPLQQSMYLPDGSLEADPKLPPMERTHTVVVNMACCGPHNNCCGATPCKNDAVFDVLDANGQVVSHLQKTYAPGGSGCDSAFCRCCNRVSNWIVGVRPGAGRRERDLMTAAAIHVTFAQFEKPGGDK